MGEGVDEDSSTAAAAAAAAAADEAFLYFVHKSVLIPHDEKKFRGGEDAASTSKNYLVVADGVGGWVRHNVNPGLFSKLLTKLIVQMGEEEENEPLSLIELVHQANELASSKHLGTATCTVLKLLDANTIQTLNIGDSGYSIHRRRQQPNDDSFEVVFQSEPGQKSFNFPHQIGGQYGDVVQNVAVEMNHTVQDYDVIVVYSDGVSDNLFPFQFHDCLELATISKEQEVDSIAASNPQDAQEQDVTRTTTKTKVKQPQLHSLSLAADCIARKAYFLGKDKKFDSPFAQGARESGARSNYMGGKHDDITVVVAQIHHSSQHQHQHQHPHPHPSMKDPYYSDSITLYTGSVGTLQELPTLKDLVEEQELVDSILSEL